MKTPIVSIIIPVYNTEEYMLKECFDSILNQNNKDYELIIVDDGSNPETANFLDIFAENHSRVKLVHNQNGGASIARNTGIDLSKGTYITFVDADDWIEPNYIDTLIKEFDSGIDIVMCTRLFEYKTKTVENHFFDGDTVFDKETKQKLILQSIISGVAGTWCKVYRKDFLEKYKLRYDSKLRRTQDIIFNLYAFEKAKRIIYIDQCIYHYRMQNESITKKYNSKADVMLTLAAREFEIYVNQFYSDDPYIRKALYYKCLNILHEICKLKLFNSENKIAENERYYQLEQLCTEAVYKNAISMYEVSNYPSMLGKCRLFLLKKKAYRLLFNLYKLQGMIEQRRNF